MKFCYFDESGMGEEPYLVMAGIIVDAHRMHVTKAEWADFLAYLSGAIGRRVEEFHSRDFYRGNGIWHGTNGAQRAKVIETILKWVQGRKHKCLFSGLDKKKFDKILPKDNRLKQCKSFWCATAMHCILQLQKQHQKESKNKGHSILIFDREVKEEKDLGLLINNPPSWTETYYSRDKNQEPLDQIVDVPYFADSKHILLAQVADLFAYILRTSAEIEDGLSEERYKGEGNRMKIWSKTISKLALPRSGRYPGKGRTRTEACQLFWDLAPRFIRELR
ncbi:MAG: DUF3800 domain-containing protein [Candidatus Abyssobacteria bacterium SURF_5]|uniref:DUF3800 domain-containing protein n=1 Tax=Abyssobacteria bacterium (strain SURF_5) TaxID=2093360 RepID=A0A3A4NYI0_ABYX5|nr:MAG: DUF3800 domain-containing protein [Candidatus Abyssubacteria bacterium SURF_5]